VRRRAMLTALLAVGGSAPVALAGPFDAPDKGGYYAGAHAVVALGPVDSGSRWGFGLDGGLQRFWHEGPYRSDVPDHLGPLLSATARLGWLRRAAYAELIASGGAMYPLQVGDSGFLPAAGLQAGLGLGLSSDGSAGPIVSANLLAPYTEARLQVMRWGGGWHSPRLSFGPMLELNCCGYLQ
jgi:hypothetical protein